MSGVVPSYVPGGYAECHVRWKLNRLSCFGLGRVCRFAPDVMSCSEMRLLSCSGETRLHSSLVEGDEVPLQSLLLLHTARRHYIPVGKSWGNNTPGGIKQHWKWVGTIIRADHTAVLLYSCWHVVKPYPSRAETLQVLRACNMQCSCIIVELITHLQLLLHQHRCFSSHR